MRSSTGSSGAGGSCTSVPEPRVGSRPLDAAECPATFGVEPGLVLAVVADEEPLEDDAIAGRAALVSAGVGSADAVVALSASGGTPYVRRSAGSRPRGRRAHRRGRLRARVGARRRRGARRRGGGRAGSDRRVDEDESRHRAEARPEHDLDGDDGPSGQDLREPDGVGGRREREAARPRATRGRARHGRERGRGGRGALGRGRRRRAWRSSPSCWPSTPTRRAPGWSDTAAGCGRAWSRREAGRRGRGRRRRSRAGRRRARGRRRRRGRPGPCGPGDRRPRLRRPAGERLRRRRLRVRGRGRLPAGGRGPARDAV